MLPDTQPNGSYCLASEQCRAYNPIAKHSADVPSTSTLCETCLAVAERDIRGLLYDWFDLEQLQIPSLSQALDTQPGGKAGPPMPLAAAPEALQAEILHVLTTWETEVRAAARLAEVPEAQRSQAAPWHTTITNRQPLMQARPGAVVQRASTTLARHLRLLATLPPTALQRTGGEDEVEDVAGWEAVLHLQWLHQRGRGMLGRTQRTTKLPGTCSGCNLDELHRDEPRYEQDPTLVYCDYCAATWTTEEYERYVTMLVWPSRTAA